MKKELEDQGRPGQFRRTARVLLALATVSIATAASAQAIRTTVDGVYVDFPDVQPSMTSGRVMVPIRGVFEHMDADVEWDAARQTVMVQHAATAIVLPLMSHTATIDGRQVSLDVPAKMVSGRVMVPLRFLSEALGAQVEWLTATRTVEITSAVAHTPPIGSDYTSYSITTGTVLPFKINQRLSSSDSKVGDRFTANLDTNGAADYQGLPKGAILEGHVDVARPKTGSTPGVLGIKFDRVRMPDGTMHRIYGTLIGLDSDSVTNNDGRLVAKDGAGNNLRYVGYGAGAGALVAILGEGNLLTNTLIGAALGFIAGEIEKDPSKSRNVVLDSGTKFGVRLTNDFTFRAPAQD